MNTHVYGLRYQLGGCGCFLLPISTNMADVANFINNHESLRGVGLDYRANFVRGWQGCGVSILRRFISS